MDLFLSVVCLFFAVLVVIHSNPVVAAFSLLSMLIVMSGIFFHLGAIFLSAIQVMVYAGAVAILFVFVLMLLNLSELDIRLKSKHIKQILGCVFISIMTGIIILVVDKNLEWVVVDKLPITEIQDLFNRLLTHYAIPFELSSLVLLAAMVAVVVLTKKRFRTSEE